MNYYIKLFHLLFAFFDQFTNKKICNFFKKKIKNSVKYQISKNIKNALANISKDLKLTNNLKKTILLSPAAASFDQFKNFESRGLYFKNLVRKYKRRLSV